VLAIFRLWHERLYRMSAFVPGTLADVTRSADVLAGLLLVLLSRGLRRRKRRAWQAVIGLLAFDIVLRFVHMPRGYPLRVYSAVVAAVLLAALVYFRGEFYASGDPRTRWTRCGCSPRWPPRTWRSGSACWPPAGWQATTRPGSESRMWSMRRPG
jgi:lysylphosphatidylglycerol synthetase-like protein (DUF2156 family)